MKSNRPRRKPVSITKTRWAAYATAGAASAFTCANPAEASIIYSGRIDQAFDGCRGDFAIFSLSDLPREGNFFRLVDSVEFCNTSHYGGGAYFGVFARYGASFAGFYNNPSCNIANQLTSVSRLQRGDLVSNRPFVPGQGNIALNTYDDCGGGFIGQFDGNGTGFIGFKFTTIAGVQYGWVRIHMRGDNSNQNFNLLDYAYTTRGERIRAGQTSTNEMVPDEGSLGWLALGATGLLAWRKRRSRKL